MEAGRRQVEIYDCRTLGKKVTLELAVTYLRGERERVIGCQRVLRNCDDARRCGVAVEARQGWTHDWSRCEHG